MFQENSIEMCILSRVKQITSPGWMHETSGQTWCTGKTQRDGPYSLSLCHLLLNQDLLRADCLARESSVSGFLSNSKKKKKRKKENTLG